MPTKKKSSASDLLDQIQNIGSSIVYLARDASDDAIKELEKSGLLSEDDGKEMAKDFKDDVKKKKNKLYNRVIDRVRNVVDDIGIETKKKS